jgi:hypothetical protein
MYVLVKKKKKNVSLPLVKHTSLFLSFPFLSFPFFFSFLLSSFPSYFAFSQTVKLVSDICFTNSYDTVIL